MIGRCREQRLAKKKRPGFFLAFSFGILV